MGRIPRVMIGVPLTVALLAGADLASAQSTTTEATAREANLRAYAQLLRSDLRAEKVAVITEVMQFTEQEDEKFWPIYRDYEKELAAINDERIALIKSYAQSYETLTDASADKLAIGALDLENKRHALKVKFYDRFKSALPAKTAARFLQVENQILLLLDLQIAAALPLAAR